VKHLLIILSFLLLSSPLFGQSKPLGVVLPPTIIGNVSEARKQILLNTLDEEVSKYFDVSPPTNVSSGDLPVVEDEQELLKKVHETKKGLLEGRWIVKNKQSFSQPSFLKTEIVDGKISFEFSVDIDPVKLDERKTEIEEDFVEQIDKEIETNIRKGVRK